MRPSASALPCGLRLATLALLALIAACGAPRSGSSAGPIGSAPSPASLLESPAPSQASSLEPTSGAPVVPSATPASFEDLLQFGLAVRVSVAELNVREAPTTSSSRVGTVREGTLFVLTSLATRAGGFIWVAAAQITTSRDTLPPLPERPLAQVGLGGWIAAGRRDEPYVEVLPPRCPATIDLVNVNGMLPGEHIACFGRSSLTLEGTYGCPGCDLIGPLVYEPRWLAQPGLGMLSVDGRRPIGPLTLHFPPPLTEPDNGSILLVAGHFDDVRAVECRGWDVSHAEAGESPRPLDTDEMITTCRHRFVVETLEVLGVDPGFPSGE